MKYRVVAEIRDGAVADAIVDAGLLTDYREGYWRDQIGLFDHLLFKSQEAGLRMVDWLVPLLRDLGAVNIRVESKREEEWLSVDTTTETV